MLFSFVSKIARRDWSWMSQRWIFEKEFESPRKSNRSWVKKCWISFEEGQKHLRQSKKKNFWGIISNRTSYQKPGLSCTFYQTVFLKDEDWLDEVKVQRGVLCRSCNDLNTLALFICHQVPIKEMPFRNDLDLTNCSYFYLKMKKVFPNVPPSPEGFTWNTSLYGK